MEILLKGGAGELRQFFASAVTTDPLVPPPPPPCVFTEAQCTTLASLASVISGAPSGSLLQTEDGGIVLITPPSPYTVDLIAKFDHTTGFWTTATAPAPPP